MTHHPTLRSMAAAGAGHAARTQRGRRAAGWVAATTAVALASCGGGGDTGGGGPSGTVNAQQAAILTFHAAMGDLRLAATASQQARLGLYAMGPDDFAAVTAGRTTLQSWRWISDRFDAIQEADRAAFHAALRWLAAARDPAVQGALVGEEVTLPNAKPIICGGLCVTGVVAAATTFYSLYTGAKVVRDTQNGPCIKRLGTDDPDERVAIAIALGCATTKEAILDAWEELSAPEQTARCADILAALREEHDQGKGKGVDEKEIQDATVSAYAKGGAAAVEGVVGGAMSVTGGPVGKFVELQGGGEVLANVVEVALSVKKVNYTDLVGRFVEIQGISKERKDMDVPPAPKGLTLAEAAALVASPKASAEKQAGAVVASLAELLSAVDDATVDIKELPGGGLRVKRPAYFTTASVTMPPDLLATVTRPASAMEELIVASEVTAPAVIVPDKPVGGKVTVEWAPFALTKVGVPQGGGGGGGGGADAGSGGGDSGGSVATGSEACSNAAVWKSQKSTYEDGKRVDWPLGTCFLDSDYVYSWCATDHMSTCACREDPSTPANIGLYLPAQTCPEACKTWLLGTATACDDSAARKEVVQQANKGGNYVGMHSTCVCSDEYVLAKADHCHWAQAQGSGIPGSAWKQCVAAEQLTVAKDAYLSVGQGVCSMERKFSSAVAYAQGCEAGPPPSHSQNSCADDDAKTFDLCAETYLCAPGTASAERAFRKDVCDSVALALDDNHGCGPTSVGRRRCVKVATREVPGLGEVDLTARIVCSDKGASAPVRYLAEIELAGACELTDAWAY